MAAPLLVLERERGGESRRLAITILLLLLLLLSSRCCLLFILLALSIDLLLPASSATIINRFSPYLPILPCLFATCLQYSVLSAPPAFLSVTGSRVDPLLALLVYLALPFASSQDSAPLQRSA